MKNPKIKKGLYKHYKGKLYEVIGVGTHSETLEKFVIYKALYKSKDFGEKALWIRPYRMFVEKIKIDNKEVKRFEFIKVCNIKIK